MSLSFKFFSVVLLGGMLMTATAGNKKNADTSSTKSITATSVSKRVSKNTRNIIQGKTNWSKIKDIFM